MNPFFWIALGLGVWWLIRKDAKERILSITPPETFPGQEPPPTGVAGGSPNRSCGLPDRRFTVVVPAEDEQTHQERRPHPETVEPEVSEEEYGPDGYDTYRQNGHSEDQI
jgi:hypothetical protein